jgi:hypothetical protein
LTRHDIEAIAVSTIEEAKKYNCDYSLSANYVKIKASNKLGGVINAVKKGDPNALSSYSIEATFSLKELSNGVTKTEQKVVGKFEGKMEEAAELASNEACRKVIENVLPQKE